MLECAANLACVGAEPLGVTNNLNFGNPEKPHIAWQLTEAVRGLGDACRALDVPVTGGNVSLYNESATGPIYPTPVIGMVGRLPDARARGPPRLRARGRRDRARRLGRAPRRWPAASWPSCGASRCPTACPPSTSPARARCSRRSATRCAPARLSSCHDVAEGGLLVALAESCLAGGLGASLDLGPSDDLLERALRRAPGRLRPLGPARRAGRAGADRAPRRVRHGGRRRARAHDRRRDLALGARRAARGPRRFGAFLPLAAGLLRCEGALMPRHRSVLAGVIAALAVALVPAARAMPRRARARPSAGRAAMSCASTRCAACRARRPSPRPRSSPRVTRRPRGTASRGLGSFIAASRSPWRAAMAAVARSASASTPSSRSRSTPPAEALTPPGRRGPRARS